MFPSAYSTVIRNEDGEPLGFESTYYDEPEPYESFDDLYPNYPEPKDTAECILWGRHAEDGDGTDERTDPRGDVYTCCACGGFFVVDDETGDVHNLTA